MALAAISRCRIGAGVLCVGLALLTAGQVGAAAAQSPVEQWRQAIEPAREAHLRGLTARAEEGYLRALGLAERFDREGPYLESTLADLAGLCFMAGRFAEAADYYRQALPMAEALYAPNDPRIALYKENLAEALARAGAAPNPAGMPAGPLPRLKVTEKPLVPVPAPEPAPVAAVPEPERVRIPLRAMAGPPPAPAPQAVALSTETPGPGSREVIVMVPMRGYVPGAPTLVTFVPERGYAFGAPALPVAEPARVVEASDAMAVEAPQQVADEAGAGAVPIVDAATEFPPRDAPMDALAALPEAEAARPVAPDAAPGTEPDPITRIVRAFLGMFDPAPPPGPAAGVREVVAAQVAADAPPDQTAQAQVAFADATVLQMAPDKLVVPAEPPSRAAAPAAEPAAPQPLVVVIPAAAPPPEFKPSELGLDTGDKAEGERPALSPELLAAQPELAPRSKMPPLPKSDPLAGSLRIPARPAAPTRHLQETAKAYEQDLEERQRQYGPNSPEMALGIYTLARLYHRQSRYTQARTMYERALGIQEDYLPDDHPDLVATLKSYGLLLRQSGFGEKAQEILARVKPAE